MKTTKILGICATLILLLALIFVAFTWKRFNGDFDKFALTLSSEAGLFTSKEHQASLPFRLFLPENNSEQKPLVLFLQSGAGRGTDNLGQIRDEVKQLLFLSEQDGIDSFYLLAPQCPADAEWNDLPPSPPPYTNYSYTGLNESWRFKVIKELVSKVISDKNIDPSRVYITGISMGATAAWEFLYRYPDFFAAALILNGRADPNAANHIARTPVWLAHGTEDNIAPISNSIEMTNALKANNADIVFREYKAGHQISSYAYTQESLSWLLNKYKPK